MVQKLKQCLDIQVKGWKNSKRDKMVRNTNWSSSNFKQQLLENPEHLKKQGFFPKKKLRKFVIALILIG